MNDYIIEKINNNLAEYLVFGFTIDSPLFELNDIMVENSFSDGDRIIFDQLLQTGNTENRFLIMTFNNGSFDYSSAINVDIDLIKDDIRNYISNFLRANEKILKYSILPSSEKVGILKGGNI